MRRVSRRSALRVGLIVLVLIAAYLFTFVGRRTAIPNTPYTLVVQPGVSDESVGLVMKGLELADRYLITTTGRTVSGAAEVRVASFSPCSPLRPIPPLAATAQVLGNRMCVNTQSGVWRQALRENRAIALAVLAHEHYHLWQQQLGCLSPPWNKQYDWLIEGGATYIGWETMIASGQLSRAWVTDLLASMRASDPKLGSLASYERGVRSDASYSLAHQAVRRLIQKTGSVGSLDAFCSRVGGGTPWRDAFAQTFGVTLDAFYAEFEAAR